MHENTPKQQTESHLLRKRPNWQKRIAIFAVVVALFSTIAFLSSPLFLITSEIVRGNTLLLVSGDHLYDRAADWVEENPEHRVIVFDNKPTRLQLIGIDRASSAIHTEELMKRSIPIERFEVLDTNISSASMLRSAAEHWLDEHPNESLTIACEEFSSRSLKIQLTSTSAYQHRIGFKLLPDRRYSSSNWWLSPASIRDVIIRDIDLMLTSLSSLDEASLNHLGPPSAIDEYVKTYASRTNHGTGSWREWIAARLDVSEPLSHVDAVVILPGDEQVRPFVAAAMIKQGWADKAIVIKNHVSPNERDQIVARTHDRTQHVLLNRGIEKSQIELLTNESGSTIGDTRALKSYLTQHPGERVAVVTSFYHLRRTRMTMKQLLGDSFENLTFISAPVDGFSAENWWRTRQGALCILTEYAKFFVYAIRLYYLRIVIGLLVLASLVAILRRYRSQRRQLQPS